MHYKSVPKVAEAAPETVELVLRLASVSRPHPASYAQITDAVMKAAGGVLVRPQVVRRIIARHAPELLFILDHRDEHGSRVEQLLKRIEKRKRKT